MTTALLNHAHELVGGKRQDAEHQMTHYLGMAAYPYKAAAKLILQTGIDPFDRAAFVIAHGFSRLMMDCFTGRVFRCQCMFN